MADMATTEENGSYGSFYQLLGVFEGGSKYSPTELGKSAVSAVPGPHGFSCQYSASKAAEKVPFEEKDPNGSTTR